MSSKTASVTGPAGVAQAMSSGTGSKPSTRGRLEEAADFVVGVAPFVEQVGAVRQALRDEGGAVGGQGVEGVRLVHEAGDGDAHGGTSQFSGGSQSRAAKRGSASRR